MNEAFDAQPTHKFTTEELFTTLLSPFRGEGVEGVVGGTTKKVTLAAAVDTDSLAQWIERISIKAAIGKPISMNVVLKPEIPEDALTEIAAILDQMGSADLRFAR